MRELIHQYASHTAYAAALARFLATDPRLGPYRGCRPADLDAGFAHLLVIQQLLFDEGWSRDRWPEDTGRPGGAAPGPLDHDILIPEGYTTLEILVPVLLVHTPHLARERLASVCGATRSGRRRSPSLMPGNPLVTSLRHVLTEKPPRPLSHRLDALGRAEVVADDRSALVHALFAVKGSPLLPPTPSARCWRRSWPPLVIRAWPRPRSCSRRRCTRAAPESVGTHHCIPVLSTHRNP